MVANLIIKAAITAASMAFNMSRRIEGPRVTDLGFTRGGYGSAWPRGWGIFWVRPPAIWAKDLEEIKQTRKTKGGKYNDYTYKGSWADGLACHPTAAVRRIKLDGHLVYDLSGAGPVTPFDFGSYGNVTDYFTFYPGSMTQDPDPAIMADVEARLGEGYCPAYRGRSYGVWKRLPVEKFGNRFPQPEYEIVSNAATHIPHEHKAVTYAPNTAFAVQFSPDFSRLAWMSGGGYSTPGHFEIWDVAARAPMLVGALPYGFSSPTSTFGLYSDGSMLFVGYGSDNIYFVTPEGTYSVFFTASPHIDSQQDSVTVVADGNGVEHWGTHPWSFYTNWYFDGVKFSLGWSATFFGVDDHGNVWVCGRKPAVGSTTNVIYFQRLVTVDNSAGYLESFSVTMPVSAGPGSSADPPFFTAYKGKLITYWEGKLYLIDPTDGSFTAGATITGIASDWSRSYWTNIIPGTGSIWLGNSEYSLVDGSLIRTESSVPASSGSGIEAVYDPINHALILNTPLDWYYLDRITTADVTLGDVVSDVYSLAGGAAADIDVSALTQVIDGYNVAGGAGKDWIEPLLDVHDVDPRPHGFLLEFLPRGGSPDATIDSSTFVRPDSGGSLFTSSPDSPSDLPALVTMTFGDLANEQQPNTADSPPLFDADSNRRLTLNMSTLGLGVDNARQLVARYARRQRFDARTHSLMLPASQAALEPGDVKYLGLGGVTVTARLVSMVVGADRRIEVEWKRDDPSVADLDGAGGAPADGMTPATIAVPLISKGFVLDLPLLQDGDASSSPLLYVAAAPYASGTWPGAVIYEAVGGEYTDEFADVASSSETTWGYATDALGDVPSPWCWDRGNSVNVAMQVGALTGCTEADIDADPMRNLCLLGSELLNFTGATLESDGSYTLTGLRRGRRGTEWACGAHVARDVFLMLSAASPEAMGLSDVGTDLSFKAATAGRTLGGAFPINLTFAGNSLKPYAPADVRAVKQANGDWKIYWKWRTRVGGAWRSNYAPSSAEASLSFHVTVGNGVSSATKTAGASPYIWTVADQTTDTGAEVAEGSLSCGVTQISATVGDGWETAIAA